MEMQESAGDKNENPNKIEVDITNKIIGDFGKWQLILSVSMALLKMPVGWYHMNIIFLAPPQDFWCQKPESFINHTDNEWGQFYSSANKSQQCTMLDPDFAASPSTVNISAILQVVCEKFVYDHTVFNRTIVSDWDLVCSKRWLVHLSQIVLMWGILLGGILFGALADKYGRRHPLLAAIIIQSVTGFLSGIITMFWVFIVNRFLLALSTGGIIVIAFVLCTEAVSGKWRTIIPVLAQLPFCLGNAVMACLAYWLRDWRKLEFALGFLSSLFMLYWFWIPESPRWLLASGQTDKALEVLSHAAKVNKKPFNRNDVINLLQTNPPRRSPPPFIVFLKLKNMRQKTLLLSLSWLCTGIAYYTFTQYLGSIRSNIFQTVAMSAIISTPGSIVCVFIVARLGRKTTIAVFQLTTAVCFVLLLLIPKYFYWMRLLCSGVGLAGMAGSVPALYLFTAELYPTIGRNVGVGGVSLFARVGSMIAPVLVGLDELVNNLTLIFLASMSIGQVILLVPLPDTKDFPLPDSLEDAERFTRDYRKEFFKNRR